MALCLIIRPVNEDQEDTSDLWYLIWFQFILQTNKKNQLTLVIIFTFKNFLSKIIPSFH